MRFIEQTGVDSLAIAIAFWMRLSIETYPGIRSAYVILPTALTGHGVIVVAFLLTRLPYDRLALGGGFIIHVLWLVPPGWLEVLPVLKEEARPSDR